MMPNESLQWVLRSWSTRSKLVARDASFFSSLVKPRRRGHFSADIGQSVQGTPRGALENTVTATKRMLPYASVRSPPRARPSCDRHGRGRSTNTIGAATNQATNQGPNPKKKNSRMRSICKTRSYVVISDDGTKDGTLPPVTFEELCTSLPKGSECYTM